MTIEERINFFLMKNGCADINDFTWRGTPDSYIYAQAVKHYKGIASTIDQMIIDGDTVECLTSKSKYIRECKKYFMENIE